MDSGLWALGSDNKPAPSMVLVAGRWLQTDGTGTRAGILNPVKHTYLLCAKWIVD